MALAVVESELSMLPLPALGRHRLRLGLYSAVRVVSELHSDTSDVVLLLDEINLPRSSRQHWPTSS